MESGNQGLAEQIGCKELIHQFEKCLHVSPGISQKSNKDILKGGNLKGVVKRRRRSRTKTKFTIRPSKLNVEPAVKAHNPEKSFSFEVCSKELESIIFTSSREPSGLRPRSSSMPSSYSSNSSSSQAKSQASSSAKRKTDHKAKKPQNKDKSALKRRNPDFVESSSCAQQARRNEDVTQDIDRLTDYLEESVLLPKKMSYMAEMMYT